MHDILYQRFKSAKFKNRPKLVPRVFLARKMAALLPTTHALGGESAGDEIVVETRR